MKDWGFWDWIAYGGIVIAVVMIAIDSAIAQSERLQRYIPRILNIRFVGFLPLVAVLVSAGAFTLEQLRPTDILALPKEAEIGSPFGRVQAWGAENNTFYMIVKTSSLERDKKFSKLVLIVRVPFADIDQMTDTNIKRSQTYTILDGFMTLAVPMIGGGLRVLVDRLDLPRFRGEVRAWDQAI